MGQPFTSVVLGWVPISPMSNPHYCLSVCISCRRVKRTPEEEPLTEVLFALLFYFVSFIKSHSLPEPDIWRLKVFVSLTVSVTGSHHVLSLEPLLRWSNRNLGNLMLQLSELFPKEKVKQLLQGGFGGGANSEAGMDKKYFSSFKRHSPVCALCFVYCEVLCTCVLCCLVRSNLSVNPSGKSLITIWWVWEQSCCVTSWKLVIGFWCCCYNLVWAVFNVSVQIVLSLKVMGGKNRRPLQRLKVCNYLIPFQWRNSENGISSTRERGIFIDLTRKNGNCVSSAHKKRWEIPKIKNK